MFMCVGDNCRPLRDRLRRLFSAAVVTFSCNSIYIDLKIDSIHSIQMQKVSECTKATSCLLTVGV